jgi:hypothetical protein
MVHERRQHLTCLKNLLANISHDFVADPNLYTVAPKQHEANMELLLNNL